MSMTRVLPPDRRAERDAQFVAFVDAQSSRLLHSARLLCGDPQHAEALAQATLERVYRQWLRTDVHQPLAYARRTMLNLYLNEERRPWREIPAESLGDPHPSGAYRIPPPAADATLARLDLLRALRTLTPRERAVVVLRYHHDLTEAQTAETLGIALGTVKSTTSRALARLRVSDRLSSGTEPAGAPAADEGTSR